MQFKSNFMSLMVTGADICTFYEGLKITSYVIVHC